MPFVSTGAVCAWTPRHAIVVRTPIFKALESSISVKNLTYILSGVRGWIVEVIACRIGCDGQAAGRSFTVRFEEMPPSRGGINDIAFAGDERIEAFDCPALLAL